MHYARFHNHGILEFPPRKTVLEMLMDKRRISGGCWLWMGGLNKGGYGQFYIYPCRTPKGVHRVAYEEFVGPIPDGLFVLHKCDVRNCFNPKHLFLGTSLDNMQDCSRKDRIAFGDRHCKAVLNEQAVVQIRALLAEGLSQSKIAKRFGCSQGNIYMVAHGKTWRRAA